MTALPEQTVDFAHPHFIGIAGTGMSAIAGYLAMAGYSVSGSDRTLDRGDAQAQADGLRALGIALFPQDGSGIDPQTTCVVVSTAIEATNPEIARAQALKIPVVHRSELLAAIASVTAGRRTIAVAGTSGKSTVCGMLYHVLEAGGLMPSLITGAALVSLMETGRHGNAVAGSGEWLIIEADESDGSLVRYHPEIALLLNVEKDHKEISDLLPLFATFLKQSRRRILNGSDPHCRSLAAPEDAIFGQDRLPDAAIEGLKLEDWSSSFTLEGTVFEVQVPGMHNVSNALAACAVGRALGISPADCALGIATYRGVERRHIRVGKTGDITVVDDFAHNPAKVAACLRAVKRPGRRVLAIFHPHGFAPMKLMGKEIVDAMAEVLDAGDLVFLPEIYYAGGTADKSISSADLVTYLNERLPIGHFAPTKDDVITAIAGKARAGDWVVSMGARDPGLGGFAKRLFAAL